MPNCVTYITRYLSNRKINGIGLFILIFSIFANPENLVFCMIKFSTTYRKIIVWVDKIVSQKSHFQYKTLRILSFHVFPTIKRLSVKTAIVHKTELFRRVKKLSQVVVFNVQNLFFSNCFSIGTTLFSGNMKGIIVLSMKFSIESCQKQEFHFFFWLGIFLLITLQSFFLSSKLVDP